MLAVTGGLFGVALIAAGAAPSFLVATVALFCVGGAGSGFQTLNNALVMQVADPGYYGRVTAVLMVGWGINGLIALPVSIFADAAGERRTFILMGAAVCVVTALIAMWATRMVSERTEAASATT